MALRKARYIRFVVQQSHPDTGAPTGIFQAAHAVSEGEVLPATDVMRIHEILIWFDGNLPGPGRLSRTKSKGWYRKATKGISWFKPDATEHLSKMRELATILKTNGIVVEQLSVERPGYVVYEDDFQIVAEPFND